MTSATDLTPMLGPLAPEAQAVDDAFAGIDRAAAQAELASLELDEAPEGEYERPYIFGEEAAIDMAFPADWLESARGAVIA